MEAIDEARDIARNEIGRYPLRNRRNNVRENSWIMKKPLEYRINADIKDK